MSRFFGALLVAATCACCIGTVSADEASREQMKGLDEQVQDVKKDVLGISTDLKLLEEKLLYPSNTEISVFVSLAGNDDFRLDALDITLDGKPVTHHIYSFKELEALKAGGMQRIYTGNVRTGKHQLQVGLLGKSSSGKEYQETGSHELEKGVGPGLFEISVGPESGSKRIHFKDW